VLPAHEVRPGPAIRASARGVHRHRPALRLPRDLGRGFQVHTAVLLLGDMWEREWMRRMARVAMCGREDAMSVIDPSQTAVPRLGRPDSEAEWRAAGVRRGGTAMCVR